MNMFERMARVITSNVNNVIKKLEDPEKIIEQAVIDMQKDLVKVRQSYAEISATQKRMERQRQQADLNANDWYRRAQLALEKGDEELAREALSRRQAQLEIVENLDKQLSIQSDNIDKLYGSMMDLEKKVSEAKREKEMMIARARTAKTSVKVTDMLSNVGDTSSAMEAFQRMSEKVDNLESQAEVAGGLAASSGALSLEARFKELEAGGINSKVEDELEMMKRQLPSGDRSEDTLIPELPASTELDKEYERLKKELGKK